MLISCTVLFSQLSSADQLLHRILDRIKKSNCHNKEITCVDVITVSPTILHFPIVSNKERASAAAADTQRRRPAQRFARPCLCSSSECFELKISFFFLFSVITFTIFMNHVMNPHPSHSHVLISNKKPDSKTQNLWAQWSQQFRQDTDRKKKFLKRQNS